METLENILKLWESDAVMDQTEPSKELLKIPTLHSKYLNILTKHKIASKKTHFDYLKMKKTKTEYFGGKLSGGHFNPAVSLHFIEPVWQCMQDINEFFLWNY